MKTKQRPKSQQRNTARGQSCRINMHTTDGPPSNGGRSGVHGPVAARRPTTARRQSLQRTDGPACIAGRFVATQRTTAAENAKEGRSG